MKHFLCFMLIACTFASQAVAQDKIKLRNGTVIEVKANKSLEDRGEYSYPNKNGLYERKKSAISYIEYENGEIEYCNKNVSRKKNSATKRNQNSQNAPARRRIINDDNSNIARFSGYAQFLGIGVQYDYNVAAYWESKVSLGCRFHEKYYIGGGFGIIPLYDNTAKFDLSVPVFATIRANFTKSRVSPYFQLDLGYKIQANDSYESGFFINPTIGTDFNLGVSKRKALFLSLSLIEYGKMVKESYYTSPGSSYGYHCYYDMDNGFYVKLGLNFGLRF